METALTKETQHSSLHFPGETEQIVQTVPSYLKKRTAEFKVEDLVEDLKDSKGLFKVFISTGSKQLKRHTRNCIN